MLRLRPSPRRYASRATRLGAAGILVVLLAACSSSPTTSTAESTNSAGPATSSATAIAPPATTAPQNPATPVIDCAATPPRDDTLQPDDAGVGHCVPAGYRAATAACLTKANTVGEMSPGVYGGPRAYTADIAKDGLTTSVLGGSTAFGPDHLVNAGGQAAIWERSRPNVTLCLVVEAWRSDGSETGTPSGPKGSSCDASNTSSNPPGTTVHTVYRPSGARSSTDCTNFTVLAAWGQSSYYTLRHPTSWIGVKVIGYDPTQPPGSPLPESLGPDGRIAFG